MKNFGGIILSISLPIGFIKMTFGVFIIMTGITIMKVLPFEVIISGALFHLSAFIYWIFRRCCCPSTNLGNSSAQSNSDFPLNPITEQPAETTDPLITNISV